MKGVIFVIFEEFITENWGAETFEDLLDDCPHAANEPFIGPKSYPDAWIVDLLTAACTRLNLAAPDALRAFGRFAFGGLISRYPNFVDGVEHPRQLLLAVHDIIHVEVKKLMEGATPPNLYYDDVDGDPDTLTVHYESARGLCALMEGLLEGAAEHFGIGIEHEQTACTHQGAARCTFALKFLQPVAS
ncbi:MAG: heme NO-binding domain-containing protein [Planctomycetota bacterium]